MANVNNFFYFNFSYSSDYSSIFLKLIYRRIIISIFNYKHLFHLDVFLHGITNLISLFLHFLLIIHLKIVYKLISFTYSNSTTKMMEYSNLEHFFSSKNCMALFCFKVSKEMLCHGSPLIYRYL